MTTPLDKTLKRALTINGKPYVVALSPEGLKLTSKGKRNGLELEWSSLVSGEAALATALNASIGEFDVASPAPMQKSGVSRAKMRRAKSRQSGRK